MQIAGRDPVLTKDWRQAKIVTGATCLKRGSKHIHHETLWLPCLSFAAEIAVSILNC